MQTVTAEVQLLLGGAKRLRGAGDVPSFVASAQRDLDRYSPRLVRATLTGDGTDEYALASPWERGLSSISRVRWVPDNDFNEPAQWIATDAYEVEYDSAGAGQIRFLTITPTSADRVVVEHSARHTLTAATATTTISETEAAALARLTCAAMLRAAGAVAGSTIPQATDEDIAVSGTDGAADQYRRLADDFDAQADQILGIDRTARTGEVRSAPVIVSVRALPWRQTAGRYLTHPRRGC